MTTFNNKITISYLPQKNQPIIPLTTLVVNSRDQPSFIYRIAGYFQIAFSFEYFDQSFFVENKFTQSVCCNHMINYCFSTALLQGG